MKNSIVRRTIASNPMVLLLLMLMLLTIHTPAVAALYTWTSATMTSNSGPGFPASPAIGNSLTVQFTYDGVLPLTGASGVDESALVPFTMTCGDLELSSASSGVVAFMDIWGLDAYNRIPTVWEAYLYTPGGPVYEMIAGWGYPDSTCFGGAVIYAPTANTDSGSWAVREGVWETPQAAVYSGVWTVTAVPVPPSVFLLGAGLIPLAWARRKKRLG